MATSSADSKATPSTMPLRIGLAMVAIGIAIMWFMPEIPVVVGTVLVVAGALMSVLVVLRRNSTQKKNADHEEAAPLHLRD